MLSTALAESNALNKTFVVFLRKYATKNEFRLEGSEQKMEGFMPWAMQQARGSASLYVMQPFPPSLPLQLVHEQCAIEHEIYAFRTHHVGNFLEKKPLSMLRHVKIVKLVI